MSKIVLDTEETVDWLLEYRKESDTGKSEVTEMGGPGSGHWRHAGRKGKRGGSAPSKGRGGVRTTVQGEVWPTLLSGVTQKEVEDAFMLSGFTSRIYIQQLSDGSAEVSCEWRTPDRKYAGMAFRTLRGSEWHADQLSFSEEFQDKGLAKSLYKAQVDLARKAGFETMHTWANVTIGRYALAKKGYNYKEPSMVVRTNERFSGWLKHHSITLDEYPTFESVGDVASFKVPGMKFSPSDLPGFDNKDVPQGMKMDLGKAFMLDLAQVRGATGWYEIGHGSWGGVMDL